MNNINTINICQSNYRSREEWEEAIKNLMFSLLETCQIVVIRYDEPGLGIVRIEFNPDSPELGCKYPYWLNPSDLDAIEASQIDSI